MELVRKAFEFANRKHEGQVRKVSKLPYVGHPVAVSYIVSAHKRSKHLPELLAASLLHDTLEDTDTTFVELATEFGALVASLVQELSNDSVKIAEVGKLVYQKNKMRGMSSYGLVIKLADRLSNLQDNPTQKMLSESRDLVNYVKGVRKLSKTQLTLINDIEEVIAKGLTS